MISSLGFLPNNTETKTLKKFVVDEEIKKRLSYLQIPLVDGLNDSGSTDNAEEDEAIEENDSIIYSTPNSEDISTLAFHIYNEEDLFVHHDVFVFSTILDSTHIGSGMVALATFEPDIFVYDAFTNFPILPQKLLSGHTGAVTGIKLLGNVLKSCSEDKSIIEWDLDLLKPKDILECDFAIERFDFDGSNIAFGAETYLNINNESLFLQGNLEKIRFNGDNVYVLDDAGNIVIYDIRNLKSVLFTKKIHEGGATDIAFYAGKIATCSMDSTVKIWSNFNANDSDDENLMASFTKNSPVCCLDFDSKGRLFCGDETDIISEIILSE